MFVPTYIICGYKLKFLRKIEPLAMKNKSFPLSFILRDKVAKTVPNEGIAWEIEKMENMESQYHSAIEEKRSSL